MSKSFLKYNAHGIVRYLRESGIDPNASVGPHVGADSMVGWHTMVDERMATIDSKLSGTQLHKVFEMLKNAPKEPPKCSHAECGEAWVAGNRPGFVPVLDRQWPCMAPSHAD